MRGQEAGGLQAGSARSLLGQGATEYLVLLAVVLIIALISIALLGFFPGMATDTQVTQSQVYWQSASPIAIVETGAKAFGNGATFSGIYLRLRNTGNYRIKITKFLGNGGSTIKGYIYTPPGPPYYPGLQTTIDSLPASDIQAGEENYYVDSVLFSGDTRKGTVYIASTPQYGNSLDTATTLCNPTTGSSSKGTLLIKNFGFEYIEYVEGQTITKTQIGKDLVIKCS